MSKIFKRIAAMCAAVMMMASISSMGVSALTYPDYSSKQISKTSWEMTTGTHSPTCSTSVSGTGTYYKTKNTLGTTGGGTGGPGGCSYNLYNPYKHGWVKAVSEHHANGYDTRYLTSTTRAHYVS